MVDSASQRRVVRLLVHVERMTGIRGNAKYRETPKGEQADATIPFEF